MDIVRRKLMGSINLRIMVTVILPVVLISLGFTAFSVTKLNQVLLDQAESALDLDAENAAAGFSAEIKRVENALAISALALSDTFDLDLYRINGDAYINEYRNEIADWIELIYKDFPDSLGLYFMMAPGYGTKPSEVWFYSHGSPETLQRIFEYPDPVEYFPENPDMQYYYQPLATGKSYWSDVYRDVDIGSLMISHTVPVYSGAEIIGIMGVDFDEDMFQNTLVSHYHRDHGYPFLYSTKERILAHPHLEFGLALDDFIDPDSSSLIAEFRKGLHEDVFHYRYAGSDKIMGYRRLDTGWFLGITTDKSAILQPTQDSLSFFFIVNAFSLVVSLLLAFLLVRIISRPLSVLHREIGLSLTDNFHSLDFHGVQNRKDEIGDVSRAFLELYKKNRDSMENILRENLEKERLSAIGDKLPNISHEIEGKLGTVKTCVTFVQDALLSFSTSAEKTAVEEIKRFVDEQNEALKLAVAAVSQASRIMQSVKNTSSDQMNLEIRRVDMKGLVEDVVISLNHLTKKMDITLAIDIPEGLDWIGYPGYLIQVLENLISNSLRHGFSGRKSGSISLGVSSVSGGISIEYKDDGVGIHSSVAEKIFDRFYTTAKEDGGTGIGLYLVKTLIESEMAGTVELAEPEGQGASFRIFLPSMHF